MDPLAVHGPLRAHVHSIIEEIRHERNVAERRLIAIGAGVPLVALSVVLIQASLATGMVHLGLAIGWAIGLIGLVDLACGFLLIYIWGRRLPKDGRTFQQVRMKIENAAEWVDDFRHPSSKLSYLPKFLSILFLAWRVKRGFFNAVLNRRG